MASKNIVITLFFLSFIHILYAGLETIASQNPSNYSETHYLCAHSRRILWEDTISYLGFLQHSDTGVVIELGKKCRDSSHTFSEDTFDFLRHAGIINENGDIVDLLRPIVRCCFDYYGHTIKFKQYLINTDLGYPMSNPQQLHKSLSFY